MVRARAIGQLLRDRQSRRGRVKQSLLYPAGNQVGSSSLSVRGGECGSRRKAEADSGEAPMEQLREGYSDTLYCVISDCCSTLRVGLAIQL